MEEARYLVWAKRKHGADPQILESATAMDSHGHSWEDQAFAEDAAGILGGCVWPPRSYSCSFCRREFRSAQALGGHMNVHRRDRARLRQSPNIPSTEVASFGPAYSSQICTLLYNMNPNPEVSSMKLISPPSNIIRVSSQPEKNMESHVEKASVLCLFSPIVHQSSKNNKFCDKNDRVLDPIKNVGKQDCFKGDLGVSSTILDEEILSGRKKRRIEAKPLSNFFQKLSSASDRTFLPRSDSLKRYPGSVDDLDLELRLGDAPKVN